MNTFHTIHEREVHDCNGDFDDCECRGVLILQLVLMSAELYFGEQWASQQISSIEWLLFFADYFSLAFYLLLHNL